MKDKTRALAGRYAAEPKRSMDARVAKAFQVSYLGSTVEMIAPGNVWDFAGTKGGNT